MHYICLFVSKDDRNAKRNGELRTLVRARHTCYGVVVYFSTSMIISPKSSFNRLFYFILVFLFSLYWRWNSSDSYHPGSLIQRPLLTPWRICPTDVYLFQRFHFCVLGNISQFSSCQIVMLTLIINMENVTCKQYILPKLTTNIDSIKYKKILLPERKRHTDSICYPVWRGVPPPCRGTPPARSDGGDYLRWGTPHWGTPWPGVTGGSRGGVPSIRVPSNQVWQGVPEMGYPPARSGWGYLKWGTPPWQGYPLAGPGWGTPHLDLAGVTPPWCGQTDGWMDGQTRVKTLPSRRTTYAVGNKFIQIKNMKSNFRSWSRFRE